MEKMTNERAWSFAIGIVQTEGIKPSNFMMDLIERQKSGEISMQELDFLLIEYYRREA